MYVLVTLANGKRKYFETSIDLAAYLVGKQVAKYRVEVYKYAGQLTKIDNNLFDLVNRLNWIQSL
jgi:hypothetical protein